MNDVVATPAFDRVAQQGVLFRHAFVTAPSCTPCRSSVLSGQYFFRTGRGAILQGAVWDEQIPTYPLLLQDAGYHIGFTYKVWSPGRRADAPYGATTNKFAAHGGRFNGFSQHASKLVRKGNTVQQAKDELLAEVEGNFSDFLEKRPAGSAFCYWFGATNPHRSWVPGSGKQLWGIEPDDLRGKMPGFLPDTSVVRQDFADYLGEVQAFDAALGVLLDKLKQCGELENTIVVVSGDHGAPGFPRGKCNLYDFGTAVPLAVRYPKQFPPGRIVDDFVNLMDLAPTFLEAGGQPIPQQMTGRSLVPVLRSDKQGQVDAERSWVITGRERHVAAAREGHLPYPQRALRTKEYLYIRNYAADRWPMGAPLKADPETPASQFATQQQLTRNTFVAFPDLDASPTKAWMVHNRDRIPRAYQLGFGKRAEFELYDLRNDPDQMTNVAYWSRYQATRAKLDEQLTAELVRVEDPRVTGDGQKFERPPYSGPLR